MIVSHSVVEVCQEASREHEHENGSHQASETEHRHGVIRAREREEQTGAERRKYALQTRRGHLLTVKWRQLGGWWWLRKERRGKVRVEIYPVRLASALSAWLGFEGLRRTSVGIVMHMILREVSLVRTTKESCGEYRAVTTEDISII